MTGTNMPPMENPFASTHSLSENPFDSPDDHVSGSAGQSQSRAQWEADLAAREAEVARQEAQLKADQASHSQKVEQMRLHGNKNWPFFYPLIFHSINDEIPEDSRMLVWRLYYLWLILLATLVVNMVACIFILVAGSSDGGSDLGSSIGYIFVIGGLSFILWYRPVYNAYMKEQALFYYFYFFFCGWHLVFSIYMIIGIPGTGAAGLIQMIQMYAQGHIVAGILGTIATVGWTVQGVGNAFYYRQIWQHHNTKGHTFNNAKTEFSSHVARRSLFGSS